MLGRSWVIAAFFAVAACGGTEPGALPSPEATAAPTAASPTNSAANEPTLSDVLEASPEGQFIESPTVALHYPDLGVFVGANDRVYDHKTLQDLGPAPGVGFDRQTDLLIRTGKGFEGFRLRFPDKEAVGLEAASEVVEAVAGPADSPDSATWATTLSPTTKNATGSIGLPESVIVADGTKLSRLNSADGKVMWQTPYTGSASRTGRADLDSDGTTVLVASGGRLDTQVVFAADVATGKKLWQQTGVSTLGRLTADGRALLYETSNDCYRLVQARTGKPVGGRCLTLGLKDFAGTAGNLILVQTTRGFAAYDLMGKVVWQKPVPDGGAGNLKVLGSEVLFGANKVLFRADAATGKITYQKEHEGGCLSDPCYTVRWTDPSFAVFQSQLIKLPTA